MHFRLHGSYQKLDFGHVTNALVDFSGGVAETYELNFDDDDPNAQLNNLMENISHELSSHSIICLKINVSNQLSLASVLCSCLKIYSNHSILFGRVEN